MKNLNLSCLMIIISLASSRLQAAKGPDLQALKRELQELRERTDELQRKIEQYESKTSTQPQPQPLPRPAVVDVPKQTPATAGATNVVARPWSPTDPIRLLGTQRNYLNLSFDALVAAGTSTADDIQSLQLGGHDPNQRGFTVQNLETTLDGKVDPYFRGQANIILQIDPEGETALEAEEAYLETLSLPWNLQVRAGHFFTEFGRLNPTHPHLWDFVDQPLINGRLFGADGLRNPGARLSWLVPTPFYSELFLAVQNSQGETSQSFRNSHEDEPYLGRLHDTGRVRSVNDVLFAPRYAASFNLSDSQTLLMGASAAFGPNGSGRDADTQIYGVDLFWKWKPVNHHGGFPFVSWQSEAMLRRFKADAFDWDLDGDSALNPDGSEQDLNGDGIPDLLPNEILSDYGFYSQLAYGFRKGWVAGLRGDWVSSDAARYERLFGRDADRAQRWRVAPNLTWYPSEFSKIRLQYNFDRRRSIGDDHSVWLQLEFLLGSHAAHKF
ncbi:MAG: hypothetical protein FJ403_15595 [Verrucomicrobia bacterium]|nr:hypothetical protein [Verrucomicrobiota bacterium]